jgi:hypothetical protein
MASSFSTASFIQPSNWHTVLRPVSALETRLAALHPPSYRIDPKKQNALLRRIHSSRDLADRYDNGLQGDAKRYEQAPAALGVTTSEATLMDAFQTFRLGGTSGGLQVLQ